ncbi:L-threonylcarbamoyladenylate synthase [Chloroflexota bacterium]
MLDNLPQDTQQQINHGITILKLGGVVAFPTDTVYGIGTWIGIPQAVERVYTIKNRPRNMALPLLLAHISQINDVACSVPPVAWLLAQKFLPGALTIVLFKSQYVPDIVTGNSATVAVRVPAHPIPMALIRGLGAPIVGTSANLSGKPSSITASETYSQFGDKLDLVIDGGQCSGIGESTIIDVTGVTPEILREGEISIEELKKVCGNILTKDGG